MPDMLDKMTLRDYFASKAMLGLLSDGVGKDTNIHIIASDAYKMSDAMLEARNIKEKENGN